jgi:parallel beta-helix repeat protein
MIFRTSHASRARRAVLPLVAATLAGAALVALPASVASAASHTTLYVGAGGTDSGNNCTSSGTPCATIAHALTLAAPTGSTIKITSGPLNEQVTINKSNVTLDGGNKSIQPTVLAQNATTPEAGEIDAIVYVQSGLSNVVLKNLTLDGSVAASGGGCVAGKGHVGLYIQSAQVTATKVNVLNVSQGAGLRGCQNGLGVYVRSAGGPNAAVTFTGGTVNNFDKNGITCNDSTTNCDVSKAKVVGRGPIGGADGDAAQNGIQIGFGATGSVVGNKVSNFEYTGTSTDATGILLYQPGNGVNVQSNKLQKNNEGIAVISATNASVKSNKISLGVTNAVGAGLGIDLDQSTNPDVEGNNVATNPGAGIALFGVTNGLVKGNKLTSNGTGIDLSSDGSGTTNVNVQTNVVTKSSAVGILAESTTSGNHITGNNLTQNRPFDAQDQSSGPANTWSSNTCSGGGGSSPAGLC